jgi:hypothetical protein
MKKPTRFNMIATSDLPRLNVLLTLVLAERFATLERVAIIRIIASTTPRITPIINP